jgi:hypothetical protein
MPYKDKNKHREVNKLSMRRSRAAKKKQGTTQNQTAKGDIPALGSY